MSCGSTETLNRGETGNSASSKINCSLCKMVQGVFLTDSIIWWFQFVSQRWELFTKSNSTVAVQEISQCGGIYFVFSKFSLRKQHVWEWVLVWENCEAHSSHLAQSRYRSWRAESTALPWCRWPPWRSRWWRQQCSESQRRAVWGRRNLYAVD